MDTPTFSRPATAPFRHSGGRVSLLALGTFAVGTDAFVVAGFLPAMSSGLDVSIAAAGQSVTVFAAAYAALSPLLATCAATMPRRRLLSAALSVLSLANLGSALAPTFAILIATRIVAAAGAAAFTPNAGAVAGELVAAEKRGRALALVVSGLTVATAIGVPVGTFAARLMGWRTAFALVALLCAVIALSLLLFLPRLDGGARFPLRTRFAVLSSPSVRAILAVTILGMTAAYTAYAYALPAFAAVGVPATESQWLLLAYGVGAVVGAQASGRLTDRYSGTRVLAIGYIVMASTLAMLGGLATLSLALPLTVAALAFLWGASSWCQTPPQQHRLMAAEPEQAALVIALNSSSIYIGIGLGTLTGGIAGAAHPSWLFFSGAIVAGLACAHLLATLRRQ